MFRSIVNNDTVSNWGERRVLSAIARRPDLKVQNRRPRKEVSKPTSQESLLFGLTRKLKTGFMDKPLSGFTNTQIQRRLEALKVSFSTLVSINWVVGCYLQCQLWLCPIRKSGSLVSYGHALLTIGIFNLIPIPALDGGKILINLIEVVRKAAEQMKPTWRLRV